MNNQNFVSEKNQNVDQKPSQETNFLNTPLPKMLGKYVIYFLAILFDSLSIYLIIQWWIFHNDLFAPMIAPFIIIFAIIFSIWSAKMSQSKAIKIASNTFAVVSIIVLILIILFFLLMALAWR